MRVAVIGGGIGGIAAAVALQARGAEVTVFAPGAPGGVAHTLEPQPGWRIEAGPHSLTHRAAALHRLIVALGLDGRLVKLGGHARARFLRRGGRLKRNAAALTLAEAWGVLRGLFRRRSLPEDVSVKDFFSAYFGDTFSRDPLSAMMTGVWAARPSELEMASAFPGVWAALRAAGRPIWALRAPRPPAPLPTGTWSLQGGLGALGEAAKARLGAAWREEAVVSLGYKGGGWWVETEAGEAAFDAVVGAAPLPVMSALLSRLPPEVLSPEVPALLRAFPYSALTVAHVLSPDAAWPAGFGYLVPESEGAGVLGTLFIDALFPDRVPAGMRAATVLLGGTRSPEVMAERDDQIRARVIAEHTALFGRPLSIAALHIVRHTRAVAYPALGHKARVEAVMSQLPPGLALAGAWVGGGAMEDAAMSGEAAAARIWGAR